MSLVPQGVVVPASDVGSGDDDDDDAAAQITTFQGTTRCPVTMPPAT